MMWVCVKLIITLRSILMRMKFVIDGKGDSRMVDMIVCGLSMEMMMAEEMGTVGKCCSCLYFDVLNNGALYCRKINEILDGEVEDCSDWSVDYR